MNLEEARKRIPELAGLSDESALNVIHEVYYPTMDKAQLAERLGYKAPTPPAPERSWGEVAQDVGITALKSAIAVPETVVGMADLVSGGRAGKLAEEAGFRPREAKAMLDEGYSDKQKAAFKAVQDAEGIGGTLRAAMENPSVIGHTVLESAAPMLASGVVARGLMGIGARGVSAAAGGVGPAIPGAMTRAIGNPRTAGMVAGALGEGITMAGGAAEQYRQQTEDGLITGEQAGLAAATGIAGTVFSVLGGRIAQKFGFGDVDTMLAGVATNPASAKGIVRSTLEAAFSEGVLEELPQSVVEQVLQNQALGRPLDEGVDQAAVLGTLAGGAMGAGANLLSRAGGPAPEPMVKPQPGPMGRAAQKAPAPAQAAAPLPMPTPEHAQALLAHANERARLIEEKAKGTKDQKITGPDGKPMVVPGRRPEFLTPEEKAEREFLNANGGDAAALAQVYPDVVAPPAPPIGQSLTGTSMESLLGGGGLQGGLKGGLDPVAGRINLRREAEAATAGNIQQFAANQPPRAAGDAFNVIEEAKARGLDFTVAPHPDGGFLVVPRDRVSPELAAQAEAELGATIERMRKADAAPVQRAPRTRSDGQELSLNTDPVAGYIEDLRNTNTPAARAYVREFDAGRVTRADVEQRMAIERGKTPDERLAEAAAEGLKLNPKNEPFKTLVAARLAAKTSPGTIIEVPGGYAIRTKPGGNAPAADQAGDWQRFSPETGTLNIPREEMPQVKNAHRGPLVNFLAARGVSHEQVEIDPAELKPSQDGFSASKVDEAADADTDRAILISSDYHIIDGHHQAVAKLKTGQPVRAIRLNAPAADLLPMVLEFPSSTTEKKTNEQDAAAQPARTQKTGPGPADVAARANGEGGPAVPQAAEELPGALINVQDAPQATTGAPATTGAQATGAQAQADQTAAPAQSDGAATGGVSAAPGAGDVQAAGVGAPAKKLPYVSKEEGERLFGVDVKRQAALDRIAKGTAYFGTKEKAGDFVAKSGIKDTHEVVQAKPGRFEIRAKAGSGMQTADAATTERTNDAPDWWKNKTPAERVWTLKASGVKGTAVTPWARISPADQKKLNDQWGPKDEAPAAAPESTVKVPPDIDAAITGQMQKQKNRVARLKREAEQPGMTLDEKRQAQTKILAAETTLRKMRTSVFDAEDAAIKALEAGDVAAFDAHADLFPDVVAALETSIGPRTAKPTKGPGEQLAELNAELERQGPVQNANTRAMRDQIRREIAGRDFPEILKAVDGDIDTAEDLNRAFQYAGDEPKAKTVERVLKKRGITSEYQKRWTERLLPGEAGPAKPAASANTIFTEDAAAAARALLKKKLSGGTLNSGIDPEILQAGITLAGYHIEKGARTFAAYAKAMVADLGDSVKPYLKSWYAAVALDPRAIGFSGDMTALGDVMAADVDKLAAETDTVEDQTRDDNATRPLDRPGQGALEGAPAADVQGTAEAGPAGRTSVGSRGSDQPGDAGTDGAGVRAPRGMGGDTGAVPVPAGRARSQRGSAGKRGAAPDARDEREPSLFGDDGAGDSRGEAGRVEPPAFQPTDFTIEEDFALGEGGQKAKYRANVDAIRLLQTLESEQRHATPDEQKVLAKYVGWGGIAQAFDGENKDWSREFAELRGLLSDEEYNAARRSTRYAHYTSRPIIQGMYDAMKRFGFTGGKILEPGAGVGNFMGLMPADLRSSSRMTGVERERIAAGIARHLYPNQNMQLQDFTQFNAQDGYFDAVIGNPPFAADGLVDQAGRKHLSGMAVHDYFFSKAVDMLRDGGVFAAVVSNGFMDKAGDRARKYIGERTKLLGAIRLPNNAFAKNANTEVTTDIVFLQKLPESEWSSKAAKADLKRWLDVTTIPDPKGGDPIKINQYFADNPQMMLGEYGRFGTMYGPDQPALVARPGQDTAALLRAAIERLPAGVYQHAAVVGTNKATRDVIEALRDKSVQEGGFYVDGGKLYQRMQDVAGESSARLLTPETQWTEKTALGESRYERLMQLAGMRRTLRDLLAAELADDKAMEGLRKRLNQQYDAYAAKHGLINDPSTAQVFDDDPDFPLLAALELNYARGMGPAAAKAAGIKPYKSKADKAPIFERRVIEKRQAVQKAETPEDALNVSIAERGRIDAGYIGQLLGRPADEVLEELTKGDKPALFVDPVTGEHVLRDAYLSGNVRKKLQQAEMAGMDRNVRALMEVQPEDVGAHEISARIGSPWVPTEVYQDFIKDLLGEGTKATVAYVPTNSAFFISVKAGSDTASNLTYGTSKMDAEAILSALLNNRAVKVTYTDSDGKTHLDKEGTDAAMEKAADIRAKFQDWIFADAERAEVLVRAYNDTNNNYVTRVYDGARMEFPGKVPDSIIKFRRHQRNAIARIVQDRTALLDHVVGAGKTFTVIAGAMELKRTGLAKKPLIVVPNHLVKQWAADFYRLYPGANILTATKKDFARENRRRFLAKIATGDWDAVIMAHSSFGFIQPDPDFEVEFNEKQVAHIKAAIEKVDASDGDENGKKRTVKQLEGLVERLENRIKSLRDKAVDNLLDFKQVGVDQLFVDEAHLFKNLMFSTKMQNVQGLGDSKGSQRAYDMYVKVNQLYAQNGRGQGVVFATGTPVSNTLAEMYHMMRYLMPAAMDEAGFQSFDAWANTFASVEQVWMQKPSGDGYKASDRMGTFSNVHELLKMFDQVSDTVTMEDIKTAYAEENGGKAFPLPKLKNDRRTPVSLVKSEAQNAYMDEIAERAKKLEAKKGPPQKGEDNFLTIMSDARKAAMDVRLVREDINDREPGARIDRATDEVVSRYKQYDSVKGTQLVFSDLGTPLKSAKKELKEYEELKARIDAGNDADVQADAALGDEAAQAKIEDAEAAQEELDAKGRDWLGAIKAALRGFSVYDDFKAALIEKGIPENEIAFIHDFNTDDQKAALFRKVNAGQIRVLLGSTQKMGAGTNVQERLVALHHLDVPWKPSDIEQREGRIVRQGNRLADTIPGFEVEILAYVTQDTLDMRMWQTQEVKLKMVNQLRTRQISREIENPFEEAEMSAGEMQAAATGNMDLLREIQLRSDLKKLEQRKRSFDAQRNELTSRRKRANDSLRRLPEQIADLEVLDKGAREYFTGLEDRPFKATINGDTYTSRAEAGAKLRELSAAHESALEARRKAGDDAGKAAADASENTSPAERSGIAMDAKDAYLKANPVPKMAVEFNGKTYGSKAALADAMTEFAGDSEPIDWKFDGQEFIRRKDIAAAIEASVTEAIDTDTEVEIGSIGGFKVTVEGQRDKFGSFVDMVVTHKGKTYDSTVRINGDDKKQTADSVVRAAERMVASLPDKLQFAKYDLARAKKAMQELEKTSMPETWPDMDKLEKARADHKEVLKRLAGNAGSAGGAPAFSRATGSPNGITKQSATQIVDAIKARWANAPEVVVVQDMQDPLVPEKVRKVDAQQRSQGAAGEPEGFWYGGKAYIVAGALSTPGDVVRVLFHEVLGHYGLRGTFGDSLAPILRQIASLRRNEIVVKAFEYGLVPKNLSPRATMQEVWAAMSDAQRLQAAEEVLAVMAQTKPEMGYVKRAIAAVRAWLRKNVPGFQDMKLTDDEIIQQFILPARRFVERGPADARARRGGSVSLPALSFSMAPQGVLDELAKLDGLFGVAKSSQKTMEGVIGELAPLWQVKKITNIPGRTQYNITTADGNTARVIERPFNPYGESIYGYDLDASGEMAGEVVGRPGDNPEDAPAADDVWIDVSLLREGGKDGELIYQAVANFAHNTGKVFIGDPAGLSDQALRRRTEQMLSSALKHGTTRHIAPHPRQVSGDAKLGVPGLKWVYGDDIGNVERMIDVSLKSLENAFPSAKLIGYDSATNQFYRTDTGQRFANRGQLARVVGQSIESRLRLAGGKGGQGEAGWRTVARGALFNDLKAAMAMEPAPRNRGSVLGGLREVGARLERDGATGEAYPAQERIFYSRRRDGLTPEEGQSQTETEAFKRWYSGEYARQPQENDAGAAAGKPAAAAAESKRSGPLDAQGRPVVFYHGTRDDITQFDTKHINRKDSGWLGRGIYGISDQEDAATYAGMKRGSAGQQVMPLFFAVTNPYKADLETKRKLSKAPQDYIDAFTEKVKARGHDGVMLKYSDGTIEIVAFRPEQVKSAIGNNGAFDPTNPDIRFSRSADAPNDPRALVQDARQAVNDLFRHPGKLSFWHKSVGTQYDLAQRSPAFKKVYDRVQDFLGDVSYHATQAADQAPSILPKLDTWRDIFRSPLTPEDNKAIAAPIFEGTLAWRRDESGKPVRMSDVEAAAGDLTTEQKAQRLLRGDHVTERTLKMWRGLPVEQYETIIEGKFEREMLAAGIVWTDAELKEIFNLSPKQIELYREFRNATDKSLSSLAISDMLRFGGKDTAELQAQAMDAEDANVAAVMLRDHLLDLAEQDDDRRELLIDTANKMIEKADKVQSLIDRGYAPLSRFGHYSLDVLDADGERVYFGLFESKAEANKMARAMRINFPGAQISQGTMSEEAYKLFAGVSPETLELFGGMLGLESDGSSASDRVFQEYLKLAKGNRSAMKRLIQRKGIAGFSEDAGRVLAGFIYSNARQVASGLHMGAMAEAASAIPNQQGELKDAALKLVDYIKNPVEEAAKFRGLLFAQYLGGSLASAMVNMLQPIQVTIPYLSQFGGARGAALEMKRALGDVLKKTTGDKDLDDALRVAEEEGIVAPQEVHQLMAQAQGQGSLKSGDGTAMGNAKAKASNAVSKVSLAWGKAFGAAEQFNRRLTFIASYRLAKAQGIDNPAAFAEKTIAETQFVYNKGNKPRWARGAVGGTIFTFKQYSISYLELLSRMATAGEPGSPERAAGRKAALMAVGVLLLMGGAGGLPFMEDVEDLIDGFMQRVLGYNFSTKQKRKELLAEVFGEEGARFVESGVSGLPGVPVDVSGRLGLGNLIPGTGLFVKKDNYSRDIVDAVGPAGDLVRRGFTAAGQLLGGEVGKAVETVSPVAARNLIKAVDMANMGMYRDDRGRKVIDTEGYEALAKAIGFQPNTVARVQEGVSTSQRMISLNKMTESEIASEWAQGIFEQDQGKVAAARAALQEWNRKNPESPIRISMAQILKRVRAMRTSKEDRIAATAPKEIRAAVRRELLAADQ